MDPTLGLVMPTDLSPGSRPRWPELKVGVLPLWNRADADMWQRTRQLVSLPLTGVIVSVKADCRTEYHLGLLKG